MSWVSSLGMGISKLNTNLEGLTFKQANTIIKETKNSLDMRTTD